MEYQYNRINIDKEMTHMAYINKQILYMNDMQYKYRKHLLQNMIQEACRVEINYIKSKLNNDIAECQCKLRWNNILKNALKELENTSYETVLRKLSSMFIFKILYEKDKYEPINVYEFNYNLEKQRRNNYITVLNELKKSKQLFICNN